MKENYENCLAVTLKWEGGDVDHPDDPGGKTRWGITQATYDAWRKKMGMKTRSVFQMERWEMLAIYRANYWDAVSGDKLPLGIDLATWDFGVNSGPSRAARYLQSVVGAAQDGKIGPQTLGAVARNDAKTVIQKLCAKRLSFLQGLKTWKTFGRGWSNRIADIEARAVKMTFSGLPAASKKSALDAEAEKAKGTATTKESTVTSAAGTGAATGTAGSAGAIATSGPIDQIVAWGLLGIAVVGIGIALYFAWKARHDRARAEAYARVAKEV